MAVALLALAPSRAVVEVATQNINVKAEVVSHLMFHYTWALAWAFACLKRYSNIMKKLRHVEFAMEYATVPAWYQLCHGD